MWAVGACFPSLLSSLIAVAGLRQDHRLKLQWDSTSCFCAIFRAIDEKQKITLVQTRPSRQEPKTGLNSASVPRELLAAERWFCMVWAKSLEPQPSTAQGKLSQRAGRTRYRRMEFRNELRPLSNPGRDLRTEARRYGLLLLRGIPGVAEKIFNGPSPPMVARASRSSMVMAS